MKPLLASLLCALALAGCGGDEVSADDYREQATEICETATEAAEQLDPPADSAESVTQFAAAAADIRELEVVALDELEPPEELADAHRQFVNASGAVVRSLHDLAAAAGRDDREAAGAASAAGARAAVQAREAASELGLPLCRQPGRPRG